MNSLPDPSFVLQLSESYIKVAKVVGGEKPCLVSKREISSAELATQPNPIIQIAGLEASRPIQVFATLSLGESTYRSHSFKQIGFSTLNDFIHNQSAKDLHGFEVGVFDKSSGLPAPTACPTPMELVFCGFNSNAIPELSDAFPNLDVAPVSITLAALDQFRLLKSQCNEGDSVLLVEIGNEHMHLFLVDMNGLVGILNVDCGRQNLYEAMAEVLHLHYIGSAIKLFTRSGFDSSELAPKLGGLFGEAIVNAMNEAGWAPSSIYISGLLDAQLWFSDAVLKVVQIDAFKLDYERLPFGVDESDGPILASDLELIAKVYTSLTSDEDYSWQNDYLESLNKSPSIPRRKVSGSNPPFPTAHSEAVSEPFVIPQSIPDEASHYEPERSAATYATLEEVTTPPPESVPVSSGEVPEASKPLEASTGERGVAAIPGHLLNDIEEYEGEFEDSDDYGGGVGRSFLKVGLLILSVAIVSVLVIVVFFPKASEKYLGIRPPHTNFEDLAPTRNESPYGAGVNDSGSPRSVEPTESEVASGLENLRSERATASFGGLFLPTNPSGATVVIGDMEPIISPVKLPNLAPGTYEVSISKNGYETKMITVVIKPREVLKTDSVNLTRLP